MAWRVVRRPGERSCPSCRRNTRVVAPDIASGTVSPPSRAVTAHSGAFAAWLRDLLDELGITRATVVGQSLGGGVAMQFTYQHRDFCERLVLISSGGLGPDLSWILRILSAPGAELAAVVGAPRPVLGIPLQRAGCSGSLRPEGSAAARYGRLLVAVGRPVTEGVPAHAALRWWTTAARAVSAVNKLHLSSGLPILLIWGAQDRIIPVAHGYATHDAVPGSRLEVLGGVGQHPHVEAASRGGGDPGRLHRHHRANVDVTNRRFVTGAVERPSEIQSSTQARGTCDVVRAAREQFSVSEPPAASPASTSA